MRCRSGLSEEPSSVLAKEAAKPGRGLVGAAAEGADHPTPACVDVLMQLTRVSLGCGMADVLRPLSKLALQQPFAFAHFNDGELRAALSRSGRCCGITTDPGSGQPLSPRLQFLIRASLAAEHPELYIGLPCPAEFALLYEHGWQFANPTVRDWHALKLSVHDWANSHRASIPCHTTIHNGSFVCVERTAAGSKPSRQLTSSTIFINGNYPLASSLLPGLIRRAVAGHNVHVLMSDRANVTHWSKRMSIVPATMMRVPMHAAFPVGYDANRHMWRNFADGDVVVILAGLVGRLLAVEWYLQQPAATYLELGSFFDPMLKQGPRMAASYLRHSFSPGCLASSDKVMTPSPAVMRCLEQYADVDNDRVVRAGRY